MLVYCLAMWQDWPTMHVQDYDPELDAADLCMEIQEQQRHHDAGTPEGGASDGGDVEMQQLERHSAAHSADVEAGDVGQDAPPVHPGPA